MAQQTAVEWLNENLIKLDIDFQMELITSKDNYWSKRNEIIEQAKQMERKQMIDVYTNAKNTWDGKSLTTLLKEYNENELTHRLH